MKKLRIIAISSFTLLCFIFTVFAILPFKNVSANTGNITNSTIEQPLDSFVDGGGLTTIFKTISVIGDSFASGTLEDCQPIKTFTQEIKDYSWPQFLARTTGNTVHNFTKSGLTAKDYCSHIATNFDFWKSEYTSDAYYIALGYNDLFIYGHEIGNVSTDVDVLDYTNNEQTFAGCLGQIISKYKELNNNAVFFLVTMPVETTDEYRATLKAEHSKVLYDLADAFTNTYIIDLYKYAPKFDENFTENYFVGGHLSTSGYLLTSKLITSYTDYIIRHNTDAFRNLGLSIPDNYIHNVVPVSYLLNEQTLTVTGNKWGFDSQTEAGIYIWDNAITFLPSKSNEVAIRFTAPNDGTISADGNGVLGYLGSTHDYSLYNVDGMRFALYLNNKKLLPTTEMWQQIEYNGSVTATPLYYPESIAVNKGDTLTLIIENGGHGNVSYDSASALLGFFWSDSVVSNMWFDTTTNKWSDDASGNQTITGTTYLKKDVVSFLKTNVQKTQIFPSLNDENELPLTAKITDYGFAEIIRKASVFTNGNNTDWLDEYNKITHTELSLYNTNASYYPAFFIGDDINKQQALNFIQSINTVNDDAKFFLVSQTEEQQTEFNQIVVNTENTYLIDLYTYGSSSSNDGTAFAKEIAQYVDFIIRKNMPDFKTFGIPKVPDPISIQENENNFFEVNNLVYSETNYSGTEKLWNIPNKTAYIAPQWNTVCPGSDYAVALGFTAPVDGCIYPTSGTVGLGNVSISNNGNGDGARFAIYLNQTKIFPTNSNWMEITNNGENIFCNPLNMKVGDTLYFVVDNGGNGDNNYDNVNLIMGFFWLDAVNNTQITWFDSSLSCGGWTDQNSGQEINSLGYRKHETISYHYVLAGNKYTISYDLDGGEQTSNPLTYCEVSPDFTLNNPTKDGFEFVGWSGTDLDSPIKPVVIKKGSTGNKTFTANWKVFGFPITYELDGGTNGNNPESYNVEEEITFLAPTKLGYTFKGWTNDGEPIIGIKKGSTGALTITAVWEINNYKISYNLDGGNNGNNPESYNVEEEITFSNPNKLGYSFKGWTIDGKPITSIKKGSTEDITLTAVWEIINYTITYNLDGGTNGNNPLTYTILDTITFTAPTKDGFLFNGWSINGQNITEITKGTTGNITLTAVWDKIPSQNNNGYILYIAIGVIISIIAITTIFILKKKGNKK